MIYRMYGKTGHEVTALGMGCMRFEDPKRIDDMAEVVLHAFDKGINYFDTAPFYCDDKSEEIVGVALKEIKKTGKPFYVTSKTFENGEADVRRFVEQSLTRLNVDCIDFYYVWCISHPETLPERMSKGVIKSFQKMKDEGLIKHICVSTHLSHELIGPMLDQGEGIFEGLLLGFNAINFPLRIQGIEEAVKRGMAVVTMNSLGGGLITGYPEHFEYMKRSGDDSLLDAALRFNLSIPGVTTALVGFRKKQDVDTAIAAMDRMQLLNASELEAFKKNVLESSQDFCTKCNYCKGCPAGIPVVKYMDAYNSRILTKDINAAINTLKWHWNLADWLGTLANCTECGQCERICTQHLPILERFEQLKKDEAEIKAEKAAKNK